MDLVFSFILGIASSIVAGSIYTPTRSAIFEGFLVLRKHFDRNAIDLSDMWQAVYKEPNEYGEIEDICETLKLKQYGSLIKGTSKIGPPVERKFVYELRLVHDMVVGHYRRDESESGAISGSGVLLLRLSEDRKKLEGRCIWLDLDTKNIEESRYIITRTS